MPGCNWRLSVSPLEIVERQGVGFLGSGGAEGGVLYPFLNSTSSVQGSDLVRFLRPFVHQGGGPGEGVGSPSSDRVSRAAPPSPGFYSRMFVVRNASGSGRPIIDLSTQNLYIVKTKFHMETVQSVLSSIQGGRLDDLSGLERRLLPGVYLPREPEVAKVFLWRFSVQGSVLRPDHRSSVFTRVMAPVSVFLHRQGIRILRYLDDWLVLASSEVECLRAR